MPYSHKRSPSKHEERKAKQAERLILKEQTRHAKKFILKEAYNDQMKHEKVCRTPIDRLMTEMQTAFEGVVVGAVPQIEPGTVLTNDYGHGVFQDALGWR